MRRSDHDKGRPKGRPFRNPIDERRAGSELDDGPRLHKIEIFEWDAGECAGAVLA